MDNTKIKISYFDEDINDMVEVVLYGRDKALSYARDKKWVTIKVITPNM